MEIIVRVDGLDRVSKAKEQSHLGYHIVYALGDLSAVVTGVIPRLAKESTE